MTPRRLGFSVSESTSRSSESSDRVISPKESEPVAPQTPDREILPTPKLESNRKGWRKLLSIPSLVATTALTAAISWGVTFFFTGVTSSPGPPIFVSVQPELTKIVGGLRGPGVVLPVGIRVVEAPPYGCVDFSAWARQYGGVPDKAQMRIVVQGNSSDAVLISNMRIKVLDRLPALGGLNLRCRPQGEAQIREIDANLDATPPIVNYMSGTKELPFGFTLSKGETEVFDVVAETKNAHCIFDIALDVIVGGRRQTIIVDNYGQHFEATGAPDRPEWDWFGDFWLGPGDESNKVLPGHQFPETK